MNTVLLMVLSPSWWAGAGAGVLMGFVAWLVMARLSVNTSADISLNKQLQKQHHPNSLDTTGGLTRSAGQLPHLVLDVVPAWYNNIELARSQTQEAIDALTQRFVGIHRRLGRVVNPIDAENNLDVLTVIQNSASQLGAIAEAVEQIVYTRNVLLRKITSLNEHNQQISRVARDMEQCINTLSVNAAQTEQLPDVQLLMSVQSASRSIIAETDVMSRKIQVALNCSHRFGKEANEIVLDSRAMIDQVVTRFHQSALILSDTVRQLEDESREVDQEICDILVHLQFQDRINQILDHVQLDMMKLKSVIESDEPLPNSESWLHDLEKTYTTKEQRQVHAGQVADKSMQSQVDFF